MGNDGPALPAPPAACKQSKLGQLKGRTCRKSRLLMIAAAVLVFPGEFGRPNKSTLRPKHDQGYTQREQKYHDAREVEGRGEGGTPLIGEVISRQVKSSPKDLASEHSLLVMSASERRLHNVPAWPLGQSPSCLSTAIRRCWARIPGGYPPGTIARERVEYFSFEERSQECLRTTRNRLQC